MNTLPAIQSINSDLPFVPEYSFITTRRYNTGSNTSYLPVIGYGDDLWFFGKEAAIMLGHSNPTRAIQKYTENAFHIKASDLRKIRMITSEIRISIPNRGRVLLPESDFNNILLKSKTTYARRVQDWLFDEALPEIRRTGTSKGYGQGESIPNPNTEQGQFQSISMTFRTCYSLYHGTFGYTPTEASMYAVNTVHNTFKQIPNFNNNQHLTIGV